MERGSGSWRNCGVRQLRSRTAFTSWRLSRHRMAGVSKRPTASEKFRYIPLLSRTGFWISCKRKERGRYFIEGVRETRTNDMHRSESQIIWRSGSENKGFAIHERLQTMRFDIGGNRRRRVSVCKIASPTPSKATPDILLHQPTGTSIWKLWRRASPPSPFRARNPITKPKPIRR